MMRNLRIVSLLTILLLCAVRISAITLQDGNYYLVHTSGYHLGYNAKNGNAMLYSSSDVTQRIKLTSTDGYYTLQIEGVDGYLALNTSDGWSTCFVTDVTDVALFSIETVKKNIVKLKCKKNNKYLGTDDTTEGAYIYCDKNGSDLRHQWSLSSSPTDVPDLSQSFVINPQAVKQSFEGWGVSLCWWANMCGKWSDEAIDKIVDWLVNPNQLNFRLFRYNIGGGDDPQNRNCDPHHMGKGKGLRAEMEGFKDSTEDVYHWERDAAQRKIMLKIKEKRPDAVFEAFSNSCPYYMTYSGCCAGNDNAGKDNLKPEYYEEFANYLVDVCKHYKDEYGIEFRTLDPFNEPQTSYWGRNGGQEGCHFDISSQVAFLKVLSPILKESGLNTVISASDETDVAQAVKAIQGYNEAGVTDLVGQFNTHTYTANNKSRTQFAALTAQAGKPMWMSEVGGGSGSGFTANLSLAQKLIDDIHYLQPLAWIDWQYIEDNDTWSLVRANFDDETSARRIKAFYVRQQFSRFIKEGYQILDTPNGQSFVARSDDGKTVVIVMLNNGTVKYRQAVDVNMLGSLKTSSIKAYRTSENEDVAEVNDFTLIKGKLYYMLPAQSVTTFVISTSSFGQVNNDIVDGGRYLIMPRMNCGLVVGTMDNDGIQNATISEYTESPSQQWTLHADGNAFRIENGDKGAISATSDYLLQVLDGDNDNQLFDIIAIDAPYYKIVKSGTSLAFDLENEKSTDGNRIGLWDYGTSTTAVHRQWSMVRLYDEGGQTAIKDILASSAVSKNRLHVKTVGKGMICICSEECPQGTLSVYTVNGKEVGQWALSSTNQTIALQPGLYILRVQGDGFCGSQVVCVN